MSGIHKYAGFLRVATIQEVYPNSMMVDISFTNKLGNNSLRSEDNSNQKAQLPMSYFSADGGFIGGLVARGTPVVVAQAESGSHYFIVSFLVRDPADGGRVGMKNLPTPTNLNDGEITIRANTNASIVLGDGSITIGDLHNSLSFNTQSREITNSFSGSYIYSESSNEVSGAIFRDRNFLTDSKKIGLDPVANTTSSTYGNIARNPARVEKREVIFEYEKSSNVKSNDKELKGYNLEKDTTSAGFVDRRDLKNDVFSLSLVSPNYLIETIKGTAVDIYGNILDLNRNIIPIGEKTKSIVDIKSTITGQSSNKNIYDNIKRLERKSIAYHFEINSRKEIETSGAPNIKIKENYARDRSRFFLDIDKEGQFKLNVPASSNTGNIPLHTRYENYSTVNPNERSNDPNDISDSPDQKDILIESFTNFGSVKLVDNNGSDIAPVDRFSDKKSPIYIGHGTVYHDISKTARHSSEVNFYNPQEFESTTRLDSGDIKPISNIVSNNIITSGDKANGGGRSGSINFDGSIELNIGANKVDTQSLWLDTEGGIIANVGQDKNNISLAASLDGNVFLELGDTKVKEGKVFDLKVSNGVGNMTVFRIDETGLSITTHGRVLMYSSSDMVFRSAAAMTLDAETITINGRDIVKDPNAGTIR